MDREVVEPKLESLRCCLKRIETKCPTDAAILAADIDLQDIISFNLSRAVQISVDIGAHLIAGMEVSPPDTMGQTFDLLAQEDTLIIELTNSLKKAVGFGNMHHNYENLSTSIVHNIINTALQTFQSLPR